MAQGGAAPGASASGGGSSGGGGVGTAVSPIGLTGAPAFHRKPEPLRCVRINAHDDLTGTEADFWTMIEVQTPTLLVSYADGSLASMGSLDLSTQYGERDQVMDDRVRREMATINGGVIWLDTPGRWWIRAQYSVTGGSPAGRQEGAITIPFVAYGNPSATMVDAHLFARRAHRVARASVSPTSSNPLELVSVQTLLNGCVAVDIQVRSQHARLYFGSAGAGAYHQIRINEEKRYEGANLPLTSFWFQGENINASTVVALIHRR